MENRGKGARRPLQWLVATALLLISSSALALGLGQIRVLSGPGQPLLAEIPIISNQPGELENARVRLASAETFARVGLAPPSGLVRDLQFEISADANGRAVVRVTSAAPVDTPSLSFLLEVDWGQGRLVREYSALVDAPQSAVAIDAPVIEAPQALPSDMIVREPEPAMPLPPPAPAPAPATEAPAAPAPVRAPPAPAPVAASAAPGEVLARVERGQTLSHVVAAMDRRGYNRDQAMIALLRANPEAFIGRNIHRVRAGAVLRMPGQEDFADRTTAASLVREQTAQWRQLSQPVPQPAVAGAPDQQGTIERGAAPAPGPGAGAAPSGARLEIAPAVAAEGTQAATSGLGNGGEGDMLANEQLRQAQEDLAARESEVQELRSRLEELEKLQQQQMKLIELKDSELAAAQQRLAQVDKASGGDGLGLWPLVLLVVAAGAVVAWWFARKPKPLPIPVSRSPGRFDAASLAAAAPSNHVVADPVVAVDAPELEPHPVEHDAYADEEPVQELDFPPHEDEPVEEAPRVEPAPAPRAPAPAWHDDASAFTPLNPAPAGRERLELAVAYLDLGDVDTARTLLREVLAGQDPAARDEAAQLLREIG